MEKQLLTLENFDKELALELLTKENNGEKEFEIYFSYNDILTQEEMERARKLQKENGSASITDGIYDYLDEVFISEFRDKEDELVKNVLKKHFIYSEITDEYEDMQDKLLEILSDKFEYNIDVNSLLINTRVNEVNLYLHDGTKYLENEDMEEGMFTDVNKIKETFAKNEFNSVAFLIQSQGYEVEDFYDKEKVENSKFLKSLHNEIEQMEKEIGEVGSLVFTKIGGYNLKEYIELEETEKNIMIPKDGIIVGLHNIGLNENTLLEIELEKDIVVDRDNIEVVSEYSENTYHRLINEKGYLANSRKYEKFEITDNESFKMHEIDLDKVIENSNKYFKKQIEKENERELD